MIARDRVRALHAAEARRDLDPHPRSVALAGRSAPHSVDGVPSDADAASAALAAFVVEVLR
jgi:hypothetical protein